MKHVRTVSQRQTRSDKNSKHENPYESIQNGDFSRRANRIVIISVGKFDLKYLWGSSSLIP